MKIGQKGFALALGTQRKKHVAYTRKVITPLCLGFCCLICAFSVYSFFKLLQFYLDRAR